MVSVHLTQWCTSPLGAVPAGLGDGVGNCHDVANLLPLCFFLGGTSCTLFSGERCLVFHYCWECLWLSGCPPPCYNDAYSVGTPKWAFWVKSWPKHCRTTISPSFGRFFLVSKRTFWERRFFYGCFISGGPGILGLALVIVLLVSCLLRLLM